MTLQWFVFIVLALCGAFGFYAWGICLMFGSGRMRLRGLGEIVIGVAFFLAAYSAIRYGV